MTATLTQTTLDTPHFLFVAGDPGCLLAPCHVCGAIIGRQAPRAHVTVDDAELHGLFCVPCVTGVQAIAGAAEQLAGVEYRSYTTRDLTATECILSDRLWTLGRQRNLGTHED